MIYYPAHSLFIHIPRTSGISLTMTAMRNVQDIEDKSPSYITCGPLGRFKRHASAAELVEMFSHDTFTKWAVMRNPWRMCESMYRHFHRKRLMIEMGEGVSVIGSEEHDDCCYWSGMSFSVFVSEHYQYLQRGGGFWHHWCCGDSPADDLGVQHILYEQLDKPQVWEKVCGLLRIPLDSRRAHTNQGAVNVNIEWTSDAIRFIRNRCFDDFNRFGYPDSP